jgi:hypothetical protein
LTRGKTSPQLDHDALIALDPKLREWIESKINNKIFQDGQDTRQALQDGVALCQLANALRKDQQRIKINAGKFSASHMVIFY